MPKNVKAILLLLFIALYNQISLGNDYTLEELNNLKKAKAITNEEYEILKSEISQGSINTENLYSLKIGGKKLSNTFEVISKNVKIYYNLNEFFKAIQFNNYSIKKQEVLIYLGETLDEIKLKNGKVYQEGTEVFSEADYSKYLLENNKIFIEEKVFETLFLSYLSKDSQKLEVTMELAFTPPIAINKLLDISLAKLSKEQDKQELIFNGKREMFNLGYMRIEGGNFWTRTEEHSKYKSDWDGKLSYQGGLLLGEFSFNYDVKEKELGDFRLDYNELWKNHTLEITKTKFSNEGEWGFHFYKDKGFYNIGDVIIIRERVPVGSRVELLYMGTPIAIENEENGEVVFSNSMIRSDRDYKLKIYQPDGKIIMKEIRTSEDYNRQQKDEIEYDISLNENTNENGYDTDINFYYGLSERLTFGGGFSREIVLDKLRKKEYANVIKSELTYGDTLNGYSYTLQVGGERTINSYYDQSMRDLGKRNKYSYLGELTKNKWRMKFEQINYAEYYDERKENKFETSYDLTSTLRLNYTYHDTNFRTDWLTGKKKPKERSSVVGINYDKAIGNILFSSSADLDGEDSKNNKYTFNTYYSGFKSFTTRLENSWTNNGEDYEVVLELYNNNLGGLLDVSAEFRYSNIEKETFGLKFNMTLDSWFKVDIDGDDHGNNRIRVGIDKIIDLKNPKLEVDNMDVSRAKIVTFVDENNNNMYDGKEKRVEGVEVKIGTHSVVTDKNGEATIYNLSNGIMYELQPTIKKTSYTMGNNIVKVQSKFSSDVDVYIPIKPMMNLNGYVNLDKNLDISPNEIEEFYSNLIIQILDINGKEIDLASPDNTGYFDISGLFPEEYTIKVYYIGDDYKTLNLNEKLKLQYDEENGFDFEIQLNITDDEIQLLDMQNLAKVEDGQLASIKSDIIKGEDNLDEKNNNSIYTYI